MKQIQYAGYSILADGTWKFRTATNENRVHQLVAFGEAVQMILLPKPVASKSEAAKASGRRYYERNKEAVKARAQTRPTEAKNRYKKKYKAENTELYRILTNTRRRRHRQATPAWLTTEQRNAIKQLYIEARKLTKLTGVKYEVDHIVPLINDDVCGLHVPWNLQVLTKDENLKKSNKISCIPTT